MKIASLLLAATCFAAPSFSQLYIDNATVHIQSGGVITVQGNVTSNVDIQGPGLLQMKGSAAQTIDMGGNTIPNLEIDNTSNVSLINSNARVGTNLNFVNGRLILGSRNLTIAAVATVTGHASNRFITTDGAGVVTKQGLAATTFTYPVGFSGTEYNPVQITNNGTADDISVRCLQNVLANGLTGAVVTSDFAGNSWVVTEAVVGGSILNVTGEWAAADELAGFNRAKSGVARFNTGTDWDLPASTVAAAAGAGPYTRVRNGINQPGVFAVADLEKVNAARLQLKVFLQGSYNATTGLMGDLLRDDPGTGGVDPVIPLTQPYNAALNARFNRVGIYDGIGATNETVLSSVFNTTGNDAIVDWVYISTLDAVTPSAKLQTRAALLQRDGDIVDLDGVSPVSVPIDGDGDYHFMVGHRNHLSVRTPGVQLLNDGVTLAYNFTDLQSKAYQSGLITTNNAMNSISGTFPAFVMWAGNANANNNVRYTGPSPDNSALLTLLGGNTTTVLGPTYSLGDLNMNRNVRYTGPQPDNTTLLTVLGGNTTAVRTEHQ